MTNPMLLRDGSVVGGARGRLAPEPAAAFAAAVRAVFTRWTALRLAVEGMSCASCAARVEKTLSETAGVSVATVNFATGKAAVDFDPEATTMESLAQAVERAGYAVAMPAPQQGHANDEDQAGHNHIGHSEPNLGLRLAVSAALSVPIALISAIMALHFSGWGSEVLPFQ